MLNLFGNRKLRNEVDSLRQENERLKSANAAAVPDILTGTAGIAGQQSPSFRSHAEQLQHFRGHQYTAIKAIATRVAGQELFVSREASAGGMRTKSVGDDLEPLPAHDLINLIDTPNPIYTRWGLLFTTVAALNLCGRAYWWLTDNTQNNQTHIYPIPPHWVRQDRDGTWLIRANGSTREVPVDAEDLACFSLPDPANPFDVVSPLQSQASIVNADEAIQTSQHAAFRNGINPSVILTVGKVAQQGGQGTFGTGGVRPRLTQEQRQQLINSIRKANAGVVRDGDAAIIDGMIENISRLSMNPQEMGYLESSKITRDRIFQAYGVNPIIVGETENANRASSWVAEYHFCNGVINPLLALMGQTLTRWVAPRFANGSEKLTVWFDPCRARDDDLKSRNWNAALGRRVVTPNEYRKHILNLPPIAGGDELEAVSPSPQSPAVRQLVADIKDRLANPYSLRRLPAPSTNGKHVRN